MAKKQRKKGGAPRRVVSKALGWMQMLRVINGEGGRPHSDAHQTKLMMDAYIALDLLARGHMEREHYIRLIELNYAAFTLSAWLHEKGTDNLKRKLEDDFKPVFDACAKAMARVGNRFLELDTFGASGNDLKLIRAGVEKMDNLFAISPMAAVGHALVEAQILTTQFLMDESPAEVRLVPA